MIIRKTRGLVQFDNGLETTLIVRAGNVKEFDFHVDDMIKEYENKVSRIVYASRERDIAGYRKLLFKSVGQYWLSGIDDGLWYRYRSIHEAMK